MTTAPIVDEPPTRKHSHGLQLLALLFLTIILLWSPKTQNANAYLTTRSVTVSSSLPSAVVEQDFQFNSLGSPSIGSIVFEYCSNTPLLVLPCTPPVGLDSSAPSLIFQSGDVGFTVHPNTALFSNKIILTRVVSASSAGTKQYRLANITNTSVVSTNYVRITTYASTDGNGAYDDTGSVAFAVTNPLTVNLYVPPYLTMCSGVTVAADCSSTSGEVVDIGELSKTSANSATTQFAVATNSFSGYTAMIVGSTMTAGNRTIPSLVAPAFSQPGVSQFGINLRQNTAPTVGTNVTGVGTGAVNANYSTPNVFRFNSGDTIANSPLSTEWNRYTISYLVNVADGQPAGRYASTLTVIATTTF